VPLLLAADADCDGCSANGSTSSLAWPVGCEAVGVGVTDGWARFISGGSGSGSPPVHPPTTIATKTTNTQFPFLPLLLSRISVYLKPQISDDDRPPAAAGGYQHPNPPIPNPYSLFTLCIFLIDRTTVPELADSDGGPSLSASPSVVNCQCFIRSNISRAVMS